MTGTAPTSPSTSPPGQHHRGTGPVIAPQACLRSTCRSVQVVQREVRQRPHADRQRRLVGEEQRRVILRRGLRIDVLRRDAEEEEQPRHLLLEEREVLGRSGERADAHVVGAGDAPQRRHHLLGQRRIVDGHRIADAVA